MSRREQILLALVVFLAGTLVGVAATTLLDDDPDTVTSATTTSTEPPPETTVSTTTSTTSPPTTTTATTATPSTFTPPTTTTTTMAPDTSTPVADATTGEILGLPIGTAPEAVFAAMDTIYSAPDTDSGWNGGCPLDGGPDDHERVVVYGNLRIRFDRWDQPERLDGWSYSRGLAGSFDPEGPTPDDIVLHDGVEWNQTGNEAAAALGVAPNPVDIFQLTFIDHGKGSYRSDGLDGTTPVYYVGYRAGDICE
jgi:hypothetical protein